MDAFHQRLMVRAATIDELLSDEFESLPGQKSDADLAARRLAAWCQSCASGDWLLFGRRLKRDGLTFAQVLSKFATVRRNASASPPPWLEDAIWIEGTLEEPANTEKQFEAHDDSEPSAFKHLLNPVVQKAEAILWAGIDRRAFDNFNNSAHGSLRHLLLTELSNLCAPALYERFARARKIVEASTKSKPRSNADTVHYDQFVAEMKAAGFRSLFEEKPVLLRLIASITRQWIDTTRELILRLDADRETICQELLHSTNESPVAKIEGELSDPHNGGHTVQIVTFEDGSRVVYKPKDLRLDVAWYNLIERFNQAGPPVELKAMRAISRDGYGWTEFIDHTGCTDNKDFNEFFRRAGAWLALFHLFATSDMHQENIIACGNHPVPIDLETILQSATEEPKTQEQDQSAYDAAIERVGNSVVAVGLLPAYGRSPENKVFAIGGMTADWNKKTRLHWTNINTDEMRPAKSREIGMTSPNLPHIAGQYGKFGDHVDDFIHGFEDYARFLIGQSSGANQGGLLDGFAGLPVRKVIRATRFYYMLHQRLKNHRTMEDGVIWSAQMDFIARLADWETDSESFWTLQRAERAAITALNVPIFFTTSDGHKIRDVSGISVHINSPSGIERVRARVKNFNQEELAWQITVVQQNTSSLSRSDGRPMAGIKFALRHDIDVEPTKEIFVAESEMIADELANYATRRGSTAAWIGLDWLGDSDVFQLVCLGPDLYNGVCGIAVFLAAHATVTGRKSSGELALAALANIRKELRSRNAARKARSLGLGAATGLGSIIYALTTISKSLHDKNLLEDAQAAVELITDDLIAADKQLDVMDGSAGAILCLLRLYRDTNFGDALKCAAKCGEHLLRQPRVGPVGCNSWIGQGFGSHALNGMAHGAAGFAYALASLAAATGRDEFAQAASECIAFEDSRYDQERHNWPDLRRGGEHHWTCQWCHGAPGIGLARVATHKRGGLNAEPLVTDICNALVGAERGWPGQLDTLCCGTLGSIEFLCAAGDVLERTDLRKLASRRLMTLLDNAKLNGDYRWNGGNRRFNLGLFRGLAGVGYTSLRQVDGSLPNVLIWE